MATRTKVTIAGAIIAAIADLLLIMLIGWHSDDHTHHNRTVHEEVPGGWPALAKCVRGQRKGSSGAPVLSLLRSCCRRALQLSHTPYPLLSCCRLCHHHCPCEQHHYHHHCWTAVCEHRLSRLKPRQWVHAGRNMPTKPNQPFWKPNQSF